MNLIKNKKTIIIFISNVMRRTWKILLITGIFGLVTQLIFLFMKLLIVGNQTLAKYEIIWTNLAMLCLIISGIIAGFIYGKPYLIKLRDWVYDK